MSELVSRYLECQPIIKIVNEKPLAMIVSSKELTKNNHSWSVRDLYESYRKDRGMSI